MTYAGKFPTLSFTLRPLLYTPTNPNPKPGTCHGLARLPITPVESLPLIGLILQLFSRHQQSRSVDSSLRVVWGAAVLDSFHSSQSQVAFQKIIYGAFRILRAPSSDDRKVTHAGKWRVSGVYTEFQHEDCSVVTEF